MQYILEDKQIYCNVSYTKGTKLSMEISPEGLVSLRVPKKTTEEEIQNFLHSNRKQILRVYSRLENQVSIAHKKEYTEDEHFLYLGKAYTLAQILQEINKKTTSSNEKRNQRESSNDSEKENTIKNSSTVSSDITSEEEIQLQLKRFYSQETKRIIKQRVNYYEKLMNVQSKSITIVDSPKTWGTCNNRKELTFNYRLSMAPIPVIDSVVIHELCHIFHLNHDRSFWRKVGSYDEHYKEHEDYLNRLGFFMTI